jgi:DNA-binding Lrp family transcriptional regulator
MTYSAYALLKLDHDANFFNTYRELYYHNNVLYCDATTGEYDIILLVQAKSQKEIKEICDKSLKNVSGIKEIELLEVSNPILEDSLKNILNMHSIESSEIQSRDMSNVVSSYVFVEVAKEKLDLVYPTLYFDDNVVYCDYTNSTYSLILLVQGTQFTEIDALIKNKIANLDGVLKVKEFPIITIFEM